MVHTNQKNKELESKITKPKLMKEALRESEELFRSAFNYAAIGMAIVALDGRWLQVNHSLCEIVGYSEEELLATTWQTITHPDDLNTDLKYVGQMLSGERSSYQIEKRYFHKEGHEIWVLLSVSLVRDGEGKPLYFICQIQDITERKQVEEALLKSQSWLQTMAEANPHIFYVYDLIKKRNVYANRETLAMLGFSPEDVIEMGSGLLQRIVHPDDFATIPKHHKRFDTAKNGDIFEWEYRMKHKNGEWLWFCSRETLLTRTKDGKPWQILGTATDISERKRSELALQESESRFQKLAANIPGAIYIFVQHRDGSTSFEYMSSAYREIFELEPEQLLEKVTSAYDQIHPDDLQDFFKAIAESAETLERFDHEFRIFTPSGKLKWLQAKSQPERRDNGDIVWYGALFDISTRKQAEEALLQSEARERENVRSIKHTLLQLKRTQSQLIQSEKMSSLGQIVAGVAHEINNPVSFIYCNINPATQYVQDLLQLLGLYQRYYPEPVTEITEQINSIDADFIAEDFPKLLESIKIGANRISKIVMSLKNFSRLDEKECKLMDIHEGIDNTLLILEHRLKQQSKRPEIQVIKEYSQLPLVECYPGKLNQVFMNIISNAIDAIEESFFLGNLSLAKNSGKIKVCTEVVEGNLIFIRIADNGLGIKPEVQQRIFDPFFTTKSPGNGTGLGLSISYQIVVEKHGGQISCNSVAGEGTELAILLPIVQKNAI